MVGAEHERVGGSFYQEIVQKIISIPGHTHRSIEQFCSTRFQVPGVRGKEGDESLGPVTRVGRDAWPSLVIEFGFSQGWNQLRRDAAWWLTNSGSRTRFIIIIKIGRNPFMMKMECWMMAPPFHTTRNSHPLIPRSVQDFEQCSQASSPSVFGLGREGRQV